MDVVEDKIYFLSDDGGGILEKLFENRHDFLN